MRTRLLIALRSGLILSAFLFSGILKAQDDVSGLFKSGPADATKLVNAYMNPLFRGLGVGLNSGWTNTARSKGVLKFDIRVSGTLAFIPNEDKTFNVNTIGLSPNVRPAAGSNGIGPTFFGGNVKGAEMELYNNNVPTGQKFSLPSSIASIGYVPTPQFQAALGLPKNIDVSLRFIPETKLGNLGQIGQFGLGAKIEILPLLMGATEKLIPIDIALAAGFTNTNYSRDLDVNNGKYNNQTLKVKLKGFSTEAIVSKKLLFFTPFASVGYNSSKSTVNAFGTYDFQTSGGSATFTDPVSTKNNDLSGMRASLGFQMNLAFFRVYAAYTQAKYNYFNGGLGFGIGK